MNHCYRFFILCCCLFASSVGWAQTNNFIISRQYKKASTTNNFNEVSANSSQAASQVSYFDGLGKPIQQVMAFGAASKGDIITLTEYDNLSRPVRTFLAAPYTSNGGTSQSAADIKSKVRSYYTNGANVSATINSGASDETFSSQTTYEPSPLNRISSLKAPGANNVVSQTYGINSDGEVKLYQVTGNNLTDLSLQVSNYEPGTLTFTRTTDENSGEVTEFKDRYGRTVLKRVKDNPDSYLDTYYVYDEKGQLRVVLQPKYAKANENDLTKNAFLYAYDDHGRITDKKVPGANATHMTYKGDTDLLETATDGNGNVFYYKYDNLNRQTEMGVKPGGTETPLLYTYYDNYTFGPFQGYSNELGLTGEQFAANPDQQRLGLQTGSKVRVLKPDGTYGDWLQTVIYYDDKYRVVQTLRQLYGLGSSAYERVSYKLAFDGKPELEWTTQATNSITYKLTKTYSYDHANRLTKTDHALYENDALKKSYTHAENLYNEVGQLAAKSLHGGRHIRNYKYTPRGWLGDHQTTSGQPFSLKLTYQENGNIATQSWATSNYSGGMNLTYDQANRLTNATGTGNFSGYNESPIQYDANGNILSLTRSYANTTIDQLSYQYNGNQLTRVDDASTNESQPVKGFINGANTNDELAYDGNGNLTKDLNRSLSSVSYNVLNLPRSLTRNNLTVLYTYDASGTKLKSEAPDNLNTFYAGAFEYRADNALLRIGLEEGQLANEAGVYSVQYYLKDHLGNVRAVMEENGTIIQETEYYAFGLPIQRTGNDKNKYLYNGKEKQPQTEWLDYGARMYDPTIGRWMVVDRYSEKYLNLSGYNYVDNNPIRNIDSNGDTLVIQYFDSNGQTQRLHYGTNAKSFDNEGNVIGGYGFYNADGTLYKGDNAFVKAASDALARLNLGDAGKSLIDNLVGNKQTINIAQGKNSYDENIHSVGWNPNSTAMIPTEGASNGLSISRSFISLGHELSHAEDHLSSKFNPEKTWIGSGVNYPESEKYATHRENQLRSEQGLPLRTHYGVIESAPGIYGPDPLSKIIDSKGNSLFYKSVNYRKR